jgi:hypothetical protein
MKYIICIMLLWDTWANGNFDSGRCNGGKGSIQKYQAVKVDVDSPLERNQKTTYSS